MEMVTSLITICFVSKYFIIFDHIYKKKIHSLLFSIEGASNVLGVQCKLMHPCRTGAGSATAADPPHQLHNSKKIHIGRSLIP